MMVRSSSGLMPAVPSSDADVTLHLLPTAHSLGRLEHFMAVANGWTLAVGRSIETIPSDLRSIDKQVEDRIKKDCPGVKCLANLSVHT